MADKNDDGNGKLGYKVFGGLSAALAAMAARKLLAFVWEKSTGKEPPSNPEHPDVTWSEAASWAVASGVAIGLARLVAQRQAAATWRRASGQLPPGLEEASA